MDIADRLSSQITTILAKNISENDDNKIAEIKYGVHILLNNLIKIPIILIAACLLGILKYVLAAWAAFSFIRIFASGIHAQRSIACLISSMIIFIGAGASWKFLKLGVYDISAVFVLCFAFTCLHAPADTENRPIINSQKRKRLKFCSLMAVTLCYVISMFFHGTPYGTVITMAMLIECVTIIPATYKIFRQNYNNYKAFENMQGTNQSQ